MTLRNLCVILVVTTIASACKGGDKGKPDTTAAATPGTSSIDESTFPVVGPNDVGITVVCVGSDRVFANVEGWRRTVVKGGKIKWKLAGNGVASVTLSRVDQSAPWPFSDQNDIVVAADSEVERERTRDDAPVEFHYSIKTTCKRTPSGDVDNIVIDPIMILPR